MAKLLWDEVGERFYQSGVDHGVLYLQDGTAVVWNGLTSVEESTPAELKSFHLDGVKYLEYLVPGDFSGKLSAYTYPKEFDAVNGIAMIGTSPGFALHDQPAKSFNLSYRTRIGNDLEGPEYAYTIHILYNVIANPDGGSFKTFGDSGVDPIEFSWALSGTPPKLVGVGFRPTVHISIDSTEAPLEVLQILEAVLYGTDTSAPSLPSIIDIAEFFGYKGALLIVDHGNGVWSAVDESDTYITMLDTTTFQIDDADSTYLDPDTYTISSTNIGEET
jgi:hypothetical protein